MVPGLAVIGEAINDSLPATRALFDAGDLAAVGELAAFQAGRGAGFVDVNVGARPAAFFAAVVRAVQERVAVPLCLDSPDPVLLRAGLEAYDGRRAGGLPLVNSLAETRPEILELRAGRPFRLVLMASERLQGGLAEPNRTGAEIHATARRLFARARAAGLAPAEIWIDAAIAPVGADLEGRTRATLEAIALVGRDPLLAGCHQLVGLSNFTALLPARRPGGQPVHSALQNAFLSLAVPRGLDTIIGNVKRDYQLLPPGDEARQALEEAVAAEGVETVLRIRRFYAG